MGSPSSRFDFEIKDKKGSENSLADYLSQLHTTSSGEISDTFPDEQLLAIVTKVPWFAHIVNYLVKKNMSPSIETHIKSKNFPMIFDIIFGKNPNSSM